ncbi:MAG: UDP-N-acetylmuramate dehydrogenase [Blautia sp.]|nr:UDP-N-acetylmuramate dehydrogenase [Blautia sp.]
MRSLEERFAYLGDRVSFQEPLKKHCSFQIGGPADVFCQVANGEELRQVLSICKEEGIPFFFLGNGSNMLCNDLGFRGVVITPLPHMQKMEVEGTSIYAEAGASFMKVAALSRDASLAGLAWARGIPGSVGGAVVMNAGAYGGEVCQVLESVMLLTPQGEVVKVPAKDLSLSYRHSRLMESGEIVLSARFSLTPGDQEEIAREGKELLMRRAEKQPLEYPSAGSTFKRPEGYFAGKLIQDAGLSGFQVGGAVVSSKHCGFVVNAGGATCEDVVSLMSQVRRRVFDAFGVWLEPEVRYLGEKEEGWGSLLCE